MFVDGILQNRDCTNTLFYTNFLDAHEGTGEVVGYLDDKLEKFFKTMEANNDLNDTVILLMADHGQNMAGLPTMLFDSQDYEIEKYLPVLFMITPKNFSDNNGLGDTISSNEQKVVTPWDIYNTLITFAGASKDRLVSGDASSLFSKFPDKRFTCDEFSIEDNFCKCRPREEQVETKPKDNDAQDEEDVNILDDGDVVLSRPDSKENFVEFEKKSITMKKHESP